MLPTAVAKSRVHNDWENSVKERTGFSKTEKATMVMSQPTREGLKMACMLV